MRLSSQSLTLSAVLLACTVPFAFAQTSGPVNSSQMDAASSRNDQASPADSAENSGRAQNVAAIQKLRQDLQSAGFTDVNIVAQSFVVQARSRDGHPVVMTIGPSGMSLFEAMSVGGAGGSAGASNSSGTVGMGSDGANSAGSGPGSSVGSGSGMSSSSGSGMSNGRGGMSNGQTGSTAGQPMQNQDPSMQK
jgi:hypothetical protein